MALRMYVIIMSLATLLCWLGWGFVIWNFDPSGGSVTSLLFFYSSFACALIGTLSLIGFLVHRYILKKNDIAPRYIQDSLRQSCLITIFIIVLFILSSQALIRWWNFILLGSLFVCIELMLFTKRRHLNNDVYVR